MSDGWTDQEKYDILLQREEENHSFTFHSLVFLLITGMLVVIRALMGKPKRKHPPVNHRSSVSDNLLALTLAGWGLGIIVRHLDLLGTLYRKSDSAEE
jgi:hypothetical protein